MLFLLKKNLIATLKDLEKNTFSIFLLLYIQY